MNQLSALVTNPFSRAIVRAARRRRGRRGRRRRLSEICRGPPTGLAASQRRVELSYFNLNAPLIADAGSVVAAAGETRRRDCSGPGGEEGKSYIFPSRAGCEVREAGGGRRAARGRGGRPGILQNLRRASNTVNISVAPPHFTVTDFYSSGAE
ncbi:hypothetical protein EVAR_63078_1 [Eumeta japonica]|uniref:Uncharacterized protein n=1 Tax=Eumeta variegata TaxID=151549 RepID=A0A4C2A036_EUMVA|nr:hypothetical protein EVAR_63078_1 [Eumeta japonica]